MDLKMWGKVFVRYHASRCLSIAHKHQNGTLKGRVRVVHMELLPGWSLVCHLICCRKPAKSLPEPQTRSLTINLAPHLSRFLLLCTL